MIALDTNVLVYSEDKRDQSGRREIAKALILELGLRGAIIPVQVLAELANVCAHKLKFVPADAVEIIQAHLVVFDCPTSEPLDIIAASQISARYRISYFDALICAVASRARATVLLSEDMADGMEIDGLRIVDPFDPGNQALLAALIVT